MTQCSSIIVKEIDGTPLRAENVFFFTFVNVSKRQRFYVDVALYYCDLLKEISCYEFVEIQTGEVALELGQ
jgi:hypothetical protein